MKKIVALVLSLVMVLGLATVAFADVVTTEVNKDGYSVLDMADNSGDAVAANFKKTVSGKATAADGTVTYYADKYEIDGATYYACHESIADKKLVKDGKVVAYLTTDDLSAGATVVATAFVEGKGDKAKCGEYKNDTYVVSGKNYEEGATLAVYKNLFVMVSDTAATPEPHTFTDDVTTDTKGKTVAITCDVCEKSFKVVEKVPASYTGAIDDTAVANAVVLLGAYAAATEDDKVESAQTFDAGIAMYVGMSVMAAAGSAVVLKKKD